VPQGRVEHERTDPDPLGDGSDGREEGNGRVLLDEVIG